MRGWPPRPPVPSPIGSVYHLPGTRSRKSPVWTFAGQKNCHCRGYYALSGGPLEYLEFDHRWGRCPLSRAAHFAPRRISGICHGRRGKPQAPLGHWTCSQRRRFCDDPPPATWADDRPSPPSLREYHQRFGITGDRLKFCQPDVKVLHPGPVNRGVELASDVMDHPALSLVSEQVTNGVAVRMALLYLIGSSKANGSLN